jgi:hypothetical protein
MVFSAYKLLTKTRNAVVSTYEISKIAANLGLNVLQNPPDI